MKIKNWDTFRRINENVSPEMDIHQNYSLDKYYLVVNKEVMQRCETLETAFEGAIDYFNSETEYEFEDRLNDLACNVDTISDMRDCLAKIKVFTGVDDEVEIMDQDDLEVNDIDPENETIWIDAN